MTSVPETAVVIVGCCNLVADGRRYLLVREAKPSARGRYNLPAGKPEVGETLVEAAEREALEESGLTVRAEHLVGVYQRPRTSEGFGVVNFVFASRVVGGEVRISTAHPEVGYFSTAEIEALAGQAMIRGTHILRAIGDYEWGLRFPLDLVEICEPSPMPADGSSA